MTVTSSTSKSRYTGNGVTLAFTGSFRILDEDHVLVTLTDTDGVDAVQTITTDYTVSGVGGSSHTVTFLVAPPSNYTVTLSRNVPATQELDLVPNDDMPADELEKAFDKSVMLVQQIKEAIDRSVRFPVSDSASLSGELPAAANRANLFLKFDADGNPTVFDIGNLDLTALPLAVASGGTGANTAALARDNLGLGELATLDLADITTGTATITAGENLADRDVIYQDVFNQRGGGTGLWYKVDTDATSPVRISPRVGIALAAIASGNTGSAQVLAGRVSGFSGLTAGAPVWASATAGGVTQTEPVIPSSGTQIATRLVGYAASATEIDFEPSADTVFTARNSALAVDGTITVQHWNDAGARDREQGAYLVQVPSTALVPGGTGTNIGDFTWGSTAGLPGIFDGVTNQANVNGGGKTTATSGYFGKTYSGGKRITQAVVWGSNTDGYVNGANPTVTLVLRAKTGTAPASRTDGTSLGSVSFTDTADESGNPRTIASSDTTTLWDHVWIDFSHNGGAANCYVAEAQFTEVSGAARDEPLTIGGVTVNASATDRVIVRYDDGAGANADTRTTFINRTNATRDLAVEVVL